MTPKYWMITNRALADGKIVSGENENLAPDTFWVTDKEKLDDIKNWTKVKGNDFKAQLLAFRDSLIKEANKFPLIDKPDEYDQQKHITLLIHGFDNTWADATKNYQNVCKELFQKKDLGICILFTWPSFGSPLKYFSDRTQAEQSFFALAEMLYILYDWLEIKHTDALKDPSKACRAKTSIISHSMGNYVLQKAMRAAWDKHNRPEHINLIDQLIMVAADVDNDLFKSGEDKQETDGDAIAYLSYRITALYTGRDQVLGTSSGAKHFTKRRLGRSGLDRNFPIPDNVWDIDCSKLIEKTTYPIHSCYFYEPAVLDLMEKILRGVDRKIINPDYKPS